jgi:TatD DNase family protein
MHLPDPMILTDSHCHLTMSNAEANLRAAREAGVRGFVVPGTNLKDAPQAVQIARQNGDVWSAVGFHPHDAKDCDDAAFAEIARLAREERVVAIGEIGLDYHYMHSPRETQRRAFEAHLQLGRELGKPVIVHAREADDDMAAMLRSLAPAQPVVVLHSFSSGDAVWEAGMAINAYFSFSGMITFKNWGRTDRLTACPADRLLVETDAPYLAPVPHRGKRNEPGFVRDVALRAAELCGESFDALTRRTTENARRCFGPRIDSSL